MNSKTLVLVGIIGACIAESPPHQQQSKTGNQAVFSQSVTREDVPVSYKYTAVHTYTTSQSPLKESNNYAQNDNHYTNYGQNDFATQPFKQIQYAPVKIVPRVEEPVGTKQNQLYTKVIFKVPETTAHEVIPQFNKKSFEYKGNEPNYSNNNGRDYKTPEHTNWNVPVQQPAQHIVLEHSNAYPTIDSSYSNLKYSQNNQYKLKPKETQIIPKQKIESPIQIVYAKSMAPDTNIHEMNLALNGHSIVGPIKRVNIGGTHGILFAIKPHSRTFDQKYTTPHYSIKTIPNPTNYYQAVTVSPFKSS